MKKQIKRVYLLNDEYCVDVIIDTPKNGLKHVNTALKKYNLNLVDEDTFMCRGKTFLLTRKGRPVIIWVDKDIKQPLATLAHEACHAVKDIFDFIGEQSIDEVFAHSVGAIVRNFEGK